MSKGLKKIIKEYLVFEHSEYGLLQFPLKPIMNANAPDFAD